MYYNDHEPPHFHAQYGDYEVTMGIIDGVVNGRFPKGSLHHIMQWHELHRHELLEN